MSRKCRKYGDSLLNSPLALMAIAERTRELSKLSPYFLAAQS